MNKYAIKRLLPHTVRSFLRKAYFAVDDFKDWIANTRDEMTPPKGLMFVGDGDFKQIGEKILHDLKTFCDLKPHERVLDVGCGIGRVAVPLTRYLNSQGSYEGFDIVPEGIRWCEKKITSKYPNFKFHIADIFNSKYYPKGKFDSKEYTFPYESGLFDVVFLTSVFTHMLPDDISRYLSEIARVLKPGGHCMITYFLLNDDSNQKIKDGLSSIEFKYKHDKYRVMSEYEPEAAVAYDESFISELYQKNQIAIKTKVYGSWRGNKDNLTYQDIIVGTREGEQTLISN